jgi:hypothetical protein
LFKLRTCSSARGKRALERGRGGVRLILALEDLLGTMAMVLVKFKLKRSQGKEA